MPKPSPDVRKVPVFFYGLFMDRTLLRAKGARPSRMQPASVKGFQLRIGQRATLVGDINGTVHGMITALSHADLERLYSESSVRDYRPEAVVARLQNGAVRAALCFNLPRPSSNRDHNPQYAEKLRVLARKLKLPAKYIASIR